jgi:hypothetical protein
VCPFCEHHNPAGAYFCNDCGSPQHLKPCNHCDAVNDQTATNCYKCGALFITPGATPVVPAADPTAAWATAGDEGVAETARQPLFAGSALRAGWRLLRPNRLLLIYVATILIAGAYAGYRITEAKPDAMEVASQPIAAGEHKAPTVVSAVPMAVESKPVEAEPTAVLQVSIPTANSEAPKRASARQRPLPQPRVRVGTTPRVARSRATVAVGSPVSESGKARTPDSWQQEMKVSSPVSESAKARTPDSWQEEMKASLASCGGNLIAHILCDQRVRRRFCEGHWGEAPECSSFVASDRGP